MSQTLSQTRDRTPLAFVIRQLRSAWRGTGFVSWWLLRLLPMAMAVGSAAAFFLWSLDHVTRLRFEQPWLLYLLPLAGLLVALLYQKVGGKSEGGTNLLVDEIHEPGGGVPRRMAPLILIGT
ncbi:MAG: hypothetical protein CFE26_08470, partial [Verrucomicrobiales bacterium VVV1]